MTWVPRPLVAVYLIAATNLAPILCSAEPAGLAERRYAILIGNNVGRVDEKPLRYAESDTLRISSVLQQFGGLTPENTILMLGASAEDIRRALLEINGRIRVENDSSLAESLLFVYYSGHAGADGLHPGEGSFSYSELRAMLKGSAATVRLLVLDGCRSGELTAVKGAKPAAEFEVRLQDNLGVEGLVMISSSAAGEDSHESDHLQASFFSHHFSNALVGAGDENGNGMVTLREAYAYAYRNTLRASGRTVSLQHPTFAYELKGRKDMVLTRLLQAKTPWARLKLAAAGHYLLLRGSHDGEVFAEVQAVAQDTLLVVQPGRYFVQYRTPAFFLEYDLELTSGTTTVLKEQDHRRVAYSRLVRKGAEQKLATHGVYTMASSRGPILEKYDPVPGLSLGYNLDLRLLTLGARARMYRSMQRTLSSSLQFTLNEYALSLCALRFVDLPWLSLGAGLVAEAVVHEQQFQGPAQAPDRYSFGVAFAGIMALQWSIVGPLVLNAEGGPVTYVVQKATTDGGVETGARLATPLTWWASLGLGWMF